MRFERSTETSKNAQSHSTNVDRDQSSTCTRADEGKNTFEKEMYAQVDQYVASTSASVDTKLSVDKAARSDLLISSNARSVSNLPIGPVAAAVSELDADIAMLEYKKLAEKSAGMNYATTHLERFQRRPDQLAHIALNRKCNALKAQVYQLALAVEKAQEPLYDAFQRYYDAAHTNLSYWDFLHFSVGAATTATFGDIAPNASIV